MSKKCTHCGMTQPKDWTKKECRYCTYPDTIIEVTRKIKPEVFRH